MPNEGRSGEVCVGLWGVFYARPWRYVAVSRASLPGEMVFSASLPGHALLHSTPPTLPATLLPHPSRPAST